MGRILTELDDILTTVTGLDARIDALESSTTVAQGNMLASGMSTVDRTLASSAASITASNQILRMAYFTAPQAFTATQIKIWCGTTAAGATPTLIRLGLYTIAANGDGTLVASTANDTTLLAATNTAYTKAFQASVGITKAQRYALGILVVTGATAPVLVGAPVLATTPPSELSLAPRITGQITGQADLPSSFLESGVSATGLSGRFFGLVLP